MTTRRRFSTAECVLMLVAGAWSVALIVGALTLPLYSSQTSEPGSAVQRETSATLVEVNGVRVLLVVAAPLLITAIIWALLASRRPERGAGAAAWTVAGLLGALTVAAVLTVGVLILPVTVCLLVACGVRQGRSHGYRSL